MSDTMEAGFFPACAATVKENVVKDLKWAVVAWMVVLGLIAGLGAGVPGPRDPSRPDVLQLLDQNGVSNRDRDAMVSFAHNLVDQLSGSPQTTPVSAR